MGKNTKSKKEKFTQPKKRSKAPLFGAVIGVGIILLVGVYIFGTQKLNTDNLATAAIGQTVTYSKTVAFQQVKQPSVKIENGKAVVATLNDLKEKKFIYTEYQAKGKRVPLTAIVKPNGKVVVAVSICEPCNSESFRIIGNTLICNACDTTWELDTFKGLSGGCQDYPPDILAYTQNGDNLEVEQSILDAWRPRV
jgi:uncharacterized protein